MKKLQRQREAKKRALDEDIQRAKQDLATKGLGFVDEDIPPDEISQDKVKRSLLTSIRTFIPYTNEWYEAMAAEDEMDDLHKIRVEKVKANDLYTMTKMGRHEEALESMMAETNHDFFFFNKIKYKWEEEGKFKVEVADNKGLFSTAGDKGANRNRFKKAMNAVYHALDDKLTNELARLSKVDGDNSRSFDGDSPCSWHGKSKSGESLQCENSRLQKPGQQSRPSTSEGKKIPLEFYQFCCFHVPFCINVESHASDKVAKIRVPNAHALCAECYMQKIRKVPPNISVATCPGIKSLGVKKKANEVEEKPLTAAQLKRQIMCNFAPHPHNLEQHGYECSNDGLIDPSTGTRLKYCAWHMARCIRSHPTDDGAGVNIPNQYGLCNMHHIAEHGHPPPEVAFPLPGMRMKLGKDFWKDTSRNHYGLPLKRPPPIILDKEYVEPPEPENYYQQMGAWAKVALLKRRIKKFGKKSSTKIQSFYRMYRVKNKHLDLKYELAAKRRWNASIIIQAQMRRFLQTKYMRSCRKLYNDSAVSIQRVARGWLCRRHLKIEWAANRIQKLMKRLRFFKFRDAVIMVMQIRRMFKKRNKLATEIQRIYRGHAGRVYVFNKRRLNLLQKIYAKRIQRVYRKYYYFKYLYKPYKRPSEEWVMKQCAKKLSRMLLELYLDGKRRKDLWEKTGKLAVPIQRLVRGFLAKAGRDKMKFLRQAMRTWFAPRFTAEFMNEFLTNRSVVLQSRVEQRLIAPPAPETNYIRLFLPSEWSQAFEVPHRIFEKAIVLWYDSIGQPLLQSEKDSIMRRFRNPVNGRIIVEVLDEYIHKHPQPCQKHGRRVCGDCFFRLNCLIGSCECAVYKKLSGGHKSGICLNCNHARSLHAFCPLQCKKKDSANKYKPSLHNPSMLEQLVFERDSDISKPINIEGVNAEGVLVPLLNSDDLRIYEETLNKQKKKEELLITANMSITGKLAHGLAEGDAMYDNLDYWDQHSVSAVKPGADTSGLDIDTSIFEHVEIDPRSPDTSVKYNEFWSIVAKNPNKKVLDYNEGFEHNMPVPVVHNGQLVFSFEGAQIYYNIVNHIIGIEEHVHYDDPLFLKLVMDHIQIFERHWRKMVVDIRTGKLDSRLKVSKEARTVFESSNVPRPALALKLDSTFRELGFHKKVLGKDIIIREYAQKKLNPLDASLEKLARRKNSLPKEASVAGVLAMSRPSSSIQLVGTDRVDSMGKSVGTASGSSKLPPMSAGMKLTRPNSAEGLTRPASTLMSAPGTAPTTAPRTGTSSKRELLSSLGKTFEEHRLASESKPLTATRRKSHSEAMRPATAAEVNAINYALLTAPRDKSAYLEIIKLNNDRFVCPEPGCGCSFFSKEAAFRHIPTHKEKQRLSIATPYADSFLKFYWPEDVPWIKGDKYSKRTLPPGAVRCSVPGCPDIFATHLKLEAHLRLVHQKLHPSAKKHGYVKCEKAVKSIPPDTPPDGFFLEYCAKHVTPASRCTRCVELELFPGPKAPVQVFNSASFDFKLKSTALSEPMSSSSSILSSIRLHQHDREYGITVRGDKKDEVDFRARVEFIILDRDKVIWFGVEPLFTLDEIGLYGIEDFPPNMKGNELHPASRAADSPLPSSLAWIPVHTVTHAFPIVYLTGDPIQWPSLAPGAFIVRS